MHEDATTVLKTPNAGRQPAAAPPLEQREFRKRFSRVSNVRGVVDAVSYWGAILTIFAAAHWFRHPLAYAVAVVLLGGLQHALINLQHDAWHRLLLRSRKWNDRIGAWLYGYPVGMPFYHERRRHLAHHRHFGSPSDDPDWVSYSNEGRSPASRLWRFLVGRLFGSLVFSQLVSLLVRRQPRVGAQPSRTASDEPSPLAEYARVAFCQAVLLGGFAVAGAWWEYFLLWALPLATVASLCVAMRAFIEHAHPEDAPPIEHRLYDFQPGLVERFFISPCHFNYHALHHAFPTIPHASLPRAYRVAREAHVPYPGEPRGGYVRFLVDHVRRLDQRP